ncbi:hypothetical protein P43SY_004411 [Pythium insidiosum]|uniref:J domain-containing protein n=1 Tax=Pythium insidiosum TaxID=114742 RepID=A0AAD5LSQ9_PYTIN|nr:hypothetical protein P43SY_004411 [Pythium insidiosum]
MDGAPSQRLLGLLDTALNFFELKAREYAGMQYATARLGSTKKLFWWKSFCAGVMYLEGLTYELSFTASVLAPILCVPMARRAVDGREITPAPLVLHVQSALLSTVSMLVASCNLYRTMRSSRVVARQRIQAWSWEMLDWVLYQCASSVSMTAFVAFWLSQFAAYQLDAARVEAVTVHFFVMSADFFLTTPQFRLNHVLLALAWPSIWLMTQLLWILAGHQPSFEWINFHTWHAPAFATLVFMLTASSFLALRALAERVHQPRQLRQSSKTAIAMTCSGSFAMLERMSTASSDFSASSVHATSTASRVRAVKSQQHIVITMPHKMGSHGLVRDVDRAIGAVSTLVVGLGLLALREFLRGDKDGKNQWERLDHSTEDGNDIYYQKKYGAPKMPLFQHRGSCDCGGLRFFILAPKRVEAFDDSNTLSCKKGRFPYLLLPTACFEMIEASSLSLYDPQSTSTQHAFCSKCGVHIFHFDHGLPEVMAINVYCIDGDTFEDVKLRNALEQITSEDPVSLMEMKDQLEFYLKSIIRTSPKMAARNEDYYRVLGVSPSATTEEIKAAYRKLVLVHHPDRAAATKADAPQEDGKILSINAAYDTLSDPNLRRTYDRERFGAPQNPEDTGSGGGNHGDYVGMTAADVDHMFSGLNTYERFSTAQYHAMRSARAPAAIGRRATGFRERKQFRSTQLPSKGASVAWLAFPVALLALWGINLSSLRSSASVKKNDKLRNS